MKRLVAGLLSGVILGASGISLAQQVVPDSLSKLMNWSFDGQALFYGDGLARTPESPVNPGNAYVRVPNATVTGEFRPNAKATSKYIDFVFSPRLSSVYIDGGVSPQEAVRGYVQQGFLRAKPTDEVSVTAGRELLTWGPGIFRSPSNPYYFNNARLDPIKELSGIDIVRISFAPSPRWTISGGEVIGSGQGLVSNDAYRDSALLKLDYTGEASLGSVILASIRGQSMFVGGYGQTTLNDATILYSEFGASSSKAGLDIGPSGTAQLFTQGTSRRSATGLIGGSYTFLNGQGLYLEYLFNGYGYTGGQLKQFFARSNQATRAALQGSPIGVEDTSFAATRSQDLLGQHYIYVQYQNNPAQGDLLWRIMAAHDIVDSSSQFSFYAERSVSSRVSVFALGVANAGSRNSDFGSLYRYSLTAGVKLFAF